jgi:diaminohydroxyphosphoribosylaminopyrimidine deaminase/5-amino-6-(5-phosphoribosylamino)uracil reductase
MHQDKRLIPVLMSEQLAHALALASANRLAPPPNPSVGCVLVAPGGQRIGQGYTQQAGGPHAEIMALRDAAANGHSTQGATAYVTLEPCAHQGRTGPCCDALVAAGIARVVATHTDPNPLVAGQGFARLRQAGLSIEVLPVDDPLAKASRALNIGFFSRMVRQTPWVRMKVAASLDGKTALNNGSSQWITGEAARADGHAWRARACAVLTGIGTVLEDNPRLDVRGLDTPRQPHLIVVDSRMETPLEAHLFIASRRIFIYTAVQDDARKTALESRGATVIHCPGQTPNQGKVDLAAMLRDLARREINEVHVEAGHKLNGSLIREGLVDELLMYLAPKLLGEGRDLASFGPLASLSDAVALSFSGTQMVGNDLRIEAVIAGRDQF